MLSLGIDYDTTAWKVAAWDEGQAADLHTFDRLPDLWDFVEDLIALHPAIPIVLPSGFGVPVTRVKDLLDRDIAEMTLEPGRPIGDGLGLFLVEARRRSLRAFCIPAVKLLPSVPPHRKLNRVDLGTSDALCAAAWAIHCLEATGCPFPACDFVLLHTRVGPRSLLVVQGGRIVDGTGAGAGQTGAAAERLLVAFGSRPGGSSDSRRINDARLRPTACGRTALWETIEKESLGLLGFHKLSQVILTGARRVESRQALGERLPLGQLPSPTDGFEAALGAALIAGGLTGGPTARLVEHLGLWETRERSLDWITG